MARKVAVIYTERYAEHDTGAHVESPERGPAIAQELEAAPWADRLEWLEPRAATAQQVALIHDQGYIDFVKSTCERTTGISYLNPDTAVCSRSYEIALLAAGGVLDGIDKVVTGEAAHFFAPVRPPGHHAEYSESLGFCLFNNIAIGARYAIEEHGLERVFILDWDVHHGNGTQHSLDNDPMVFFCSFHQYPHYPGTGRVEDRGKGDGLGYNLNFPMHSGSSNDDYLYLMEEVVDDVMAKFRPQLVLVSAGFDAHTDDPLSGIDLTEEAYSAMVESMQNTVGQDVPFGLVLEGGYNLGSLSRSAAAAVSVLAGEASTYQAVAKSPSRLAVSLAEQHHKEHPFLKKD